MTQIEKQKQRMEARLKELTERMESVEKELEEPVEADLEDQAIELEDDEVLEGVAKAAAHEIAQLRGALERIDKGTYGICTGCGDPIPEARLEAVPYATRCQACASGANG